MLQTITVQNIFIEIENIFKKLKIFFIAVEMFL